MEQKPPNPSSFASACATWARRLRTTYSAFHRNGDLLRDLECQLTLGCEESYVLVCFGLTRILGIVFGLALRSGDRIGVQLVGLPVDFHRSERHLQFVLFNLDDAAGY